MSAFSRANARFSHLLTTGSAFLPPFAGRLPGARARSSADPRGAISLAAASRAPRRAGLTVALAIAGAVATVAVAGCATAPTDGGSATGSTAKARPGFQPVRGQYGKDVIWIPTPDRFVGRMLQLAGVENGDRLVDLGSGDGKIVIAAARLPGVSARGIEYNADLVGFARDAAAKAGVGAGARFEQGDIFSSDFGDATVVTMYLLPQLNLRLRETLFGLKPGTRVVSHAWSMGNWPADETSLINGTPIFLWIVPANAGGRWQVDFAEDGKPGSLTVSFEQTYQRLGKARAVIDGIDNSIRQPRLEGDRLRFELTDGTGVLRRFDGRIDGATIRGEVTGPGETRTPFTATRIGDAPPIIGARGYSEQEAGQVEAELGIGG